jgi:hypothetical protein
MGTPVKSVIAFSDCKGPSAHPEVLKPHRLQAFKVYWCKCTRGAKDRLEKSITYETNFRLICKCLQEIVTIFSHIGFVSSRAEAVRTPPNQLITKNKTHFLSESPGLHGNAPMVPQLHSFLVTRGGSPGSC